MAVSSLRARALFALCARRAGAARGARPTARCTAAAAAPGGAAPPPPPALAPLPRARALHAAPPARRAAALPPLRAAADAGCTVAGPACDPVRDVALSVSSATAIDWSGDLLALGVFEDALESPELGALDTRLGGAVRELIAEGEFKAKAGSSVSGRVTVSGGGPGGARRVVLVGLGARAASAGADGASPAGWKAFGGAAAAAARACKASSLGVAVVGAPPAGLSEAALRALAAGVLLGAYEDARFKSKPKALALRSAALLSLAGAAATAAVTGASGVAHARALTAGVLLTKQLVSAPPNVATPSALAAAAAAIAADFPDTFTLRVLEKEECAARGMGAFLGVAEASDEPPKLIHLTYTPKGGAAAGTPVLGLVGKGARAWRCHVRAQARACGTRRSLHADADVVFLLCLRVCARASGLTFDSGGYNIKAGAGSMIGARLSVSRLHARVPCCLLR
jgi:leucyl aminopeptidase